MDKQTQVDTRVNVNDEISIEIPLFILFSEFLGYVSPLNKFAEEWCNGTVPQMCIQKFMAVEAKSILRQMKKDYALDDIRLYYNMYYDAIFKELDDKLKSLIITSESDT